MLPLEMAASDGLLHASWIAWQLSITPRGDMRCAIGMGFSNSKLPMDFKSRSQTTGWILIHGSFQDTMSLLKSSTTAMCGSTSESKDLMYCAMLRI